MFLIFGLYRQNVLSLGDTGLQRAKRLLFGDFVATFRYLTSIYYID